MKKVKKSGSHLCSLAADDESAARAALRSRRPVAAHNLGAPLAAREHLTARRSSATISGVRAMPSEKIFRLLLKISVHGLAYE